MIRLWIATTVLGAALAAGASYSELLGRLEGAPLLKRAEMMRKAAEEAALATEGARLPTLDATLQGAWLNETPMIYFHTPQGETLPLPIGTTRRFEGEVRLRYPLFTGFALDAALSKSRLEAERARLAKQDAKRNLALQLTRLYGGIEATQKQLAALNEAVRALQTAEKKARAMEEKGLLAPAARYKIQAQRFDIEAQALQTRHAVAQLLNRLGYLTATRVQRIEGKMRFAPLPPLARLKATALRQRSDVQALYRLLDIDDETIRMAKSRFYPTVGVEAALKRQGNTLALNGDGFSNADQSYVGMEVSWNLFSGQKDRHTLEAARYRKLATVAQLEDYRRRVVTELENAYLDWQTLRAKRKSARMQLRAQREYYKLTKGRFEQRFADADELSRAIADLAAAKANLAAVEAQLAVQQATVWLMSGLASFEKSVRK